MQLSCGPWSYNRFNQFEQTLQEGKKPDFLDKDGDGDKKESFKKAVSDSKKDCDCKDKEDCDCDGKKDSKKPAFLQKEANSYQAKAGKVKNATPTGKKIPQELAAEGYADAIAKSTAKFGKGVVDTAKKSAGAVNKAINTATGRKDVKEAIVNNLMANGLANNPVSAEIIAEHMSDEWAQAIVDELG